jgi:hypothetical protein
MQPDFVCCTTAGAGNVPMEALVEVAIAGASGTAGPAPLDMGPPCIDVGASEAYLLPGLPDCGPMSELALSHGGSQPWHVARVLVHNQRSGQRATFVFDRWAGGAAD